MKNFKIDENVFETLPNYCVGLVEAKGINNTVVNARIDALLEENISTFMRNFKDANVREIPNIKRFRDAFQELGINPNKYMCSIEALSKRVQKVGELPHINSIVDLGNALSLKYQLAAGAHDVDKLDSDLEVRYSTVNDNFLPMGGSELEMLPEGELIYVSGNTVKTRRWIWRQSDDGKITQETNHVFFPIDGFEDTNLEQVLQARDELAKILKEEFNCEIRTALINKQNNSLF